MKKLDPRIVWNEEIKKSGNIYFDQSVKLLQEYHQTMDLFGNPAIDLSNKPVIKSNRDWLFYLEALQEVLIIGHRNNILRVHLDGSGKPVYFLIDIK